MWLPIVNMVLKLSKFQSAAISLIMKISRPNCLHLIDLEKLFPMVSSIFCTVMSGSKVIGQKPTKIWSQSQIFKISICHHFLNNEDIKTKCSASDRSWEALSDVTSILHCDERFKSYHQKTKLNWSWKSNFQNFNLPPFP